jgi:acyl-CoA thioester hydrolase
MLESRTSIQVRFAETDQMGIVYHGSYFPWLEVGRTRLLDDFGFNYRALSESGYHLPVLEVAVKYLRPARYDDEVVIHTRIKTKPGVRIKIEYELFCDDTRLVTASTLHAFIDHHGLPVRPPANFMAAINQHFGA